MAGFPENLTTATILQDVEEKVIMAHFVGNG
jgi:hypothetical protein